MGNAKETERFILSSNFNDELNRFIESGRRVLRKDEQSSVIIGKIIEHFLSDLKPEDITAPTLCKLLLESLRLARKKGFAPLGLLSFDPLTQIVDLQEALPKTLPTFLESVSPNNGVT
jgi:hypothetical protein